MPRPPNRDARILAAYSAGATISQIVLNEQIDPAIVVRAAHAYHAAPPRRDPPARPSPGQRHNRRAPVRRAVPGGRCQRTSQGKPEALLLN